MKTNLQKLTNLLCEVEEIRKDLEKKAYISWLCFEKNKGLKVNIWLNIEIIDFWGCSSKEEAMWKHFKRLQKTEIYKEHSLFIDCQLEIDKELEYYHLMMYLKKKDINYVEIKWLLLDWTKFKTFNKMPIICRLKPKQLYQQSEETLWKIFNYLIDIKNEM